MFSLSESNRYLVCAQATDLRKGVNSLCGIVRMNGMQATDGRVYVFLNRNRTRMKLLHWERGGYVIFYKRMEQGRISPQVFKGAEDGGFWEIRWDELVLFVEGIRLSVDRRKRYNKQG